MTVLAIGLLLFLGTHSIRIVADDWRSDQRRRLGELRWKGLYSLVSLAGFAMIVWGFGLARPAPVVLWTPPVWSRHLAAALTLPAFILLAAAYVPGNRIKAKIGHPMLAAVKTWALAHLIANGTAADVLLFGAFLIWAIADFIVSRRRDRAAGTTYPALGMGRDILTIAAGAVAWILFARFGHEWLIGVRPFG